MRMFLERVLCPASGHDQGLLVHVTPPLILPTVQSQMQLPFTGPLKLPIGGKSPPKAENDQPDTNSSIFDHRAGRFGSNILNAMKRRLVARSSTKVHLCALPLWDQYRMESGEPQVRLCENRSELHLDGETEAVWRYLFKDGNTFNAIFSILHIHSYDCSP